VPKTPVPGTDVAGVVSAVGHEVTRFHPGDEVFGTGQGTFAEYARAPESKLAPKPASLTFEQAATWSGPSAPTTSSTTRVRTSRTASSATT
jgi:NADPH:quinone reductase-like Zn-dependent oxidoreductase